MHTWLVTYPKEPKPDIRSIQILQSKTMQVLYFIRSHLNVNIHVFTQSYSFTQRRLTTSEHQITLLLLINVETGETAGPWSHQGSIWKSKHIQMKMTPSVKL